MKLNDIDTNINPKNPMIENVINSMANDTKGIKENSLEESLLIKKEITEELLNVPVTKRFSDIATGKDLPIDNFVKVKIDSILNKEMTLLGFEIFKSKFNKGLCTVLKFIDSEGHKIKVFTGSHVLENQCRKYIDEMPFITKLIKTDKYYSFS